MFDIKSAPKALAEASEGSFAIKAMDGDTPELLIMDDIGEDMFGGGISATQVKTFLNDNRGKGVTARFNSFGGSAYEGVVMHNAFSEHGNVTAVIDGIAFSAAAIAASGANRLVMHEASDFGIHYSWTMAAGNATQLQGAIEWLNSVDEKQILIYMNRTGASRDQVEAWLTGTDDGTLFSAQEALEAGFADEVISLKKKEDYNSKAKRTMKQVAHKRLAASIKQKRLSRGTH